MSCLFNYYLF